MLREIEGELVRAERGQPVDVKKTAEKLRSVIHTLNQQANVKMTPETQKMFQAQRETAKGLTSRVNALASKTANTPSWIRPAVYTALGVIGVAALALAAQKMGSVPVPPGSGVGGTGTGVGGTGTGTGVGGTGTGTGVGGTGTGVGGTGTGVGGGKPGSAPTSPVNTNSSTASPSTTPAPASQSAAPTPSSPSQTAPASPSTTPAPSPVSPIATASATSVPTSSSDTNSSTASATSVPTPSVGTSPATASATLAPKIESFSLASSQAATVTPSIRSFTATLTPDTEKAAKIKEQGRIAREAFEAARSNCPAEFPVNGQKDLSYRTDWMFKGQCPKDLDGFVDYQLKNGYLPKFSVESLQDLFGGKQDLNDAETRLLYLTLDKSIGHMFDPENPLSVKNPRMAEGLAAAGIRDAARKYTRLRTDDSQLGWMERVAAFLWYGGSKAYLETRDHGKYGAIEPGNPDFVVGKNLVQDNENATVAAIIGKAQTTSQEFNKRVQPLSPTRQPSPESLRVSGGSEGPAQIVFPANLYPTGTSVIPPKRQEAGMNDIREPAAKGSSSWSALNMTATIDWLSENVFQPVVDYDYNGAARRMISSVNDSIIQPLAPHVENAVTRADRGLTAAGNKLGDSIGSKNVVGRIVKENPQMSALSAGSSMIGMVAKLKSTWASVLQAAHAATQAPAIPNVWRNNRPKWLMLQRNAYVYTLVSGTLVTAGTGLALGLALPPAIYVAHKLGTAIGDLAYNQFFKNATPQTKA